MSTGIVGAGNGGRGWASDIIGIARRAGGVRAAVGCYPGFSLNVRLRLPAGSSRCGSFIRRSVKFAVAWVAAV